MGSHRHPPGAGNNSAPRSGERLLVHMGMGEKPLPDNKTIDEHLPSIGVRLPTDIVGSNGDRKRPSASLVRCRRDTGDVGTSHWAARVGATTGNEEQRRYRQDDESA